MTSSSSKVKVCLNLICITPVYQYPLNTGLGESNNLVLFSTYTGYARELRVWNHDSGNDYLHFWRRQIINPYDISTLKDYWRLLGDDNTEITFHYNYPTTPILSTILTIPISTDPTRLNECLHGWYHNGAACKEDDKVLKSENALSDVSAFRINATEPAAYTVGVWFTISKLIPNQQYFCCRDRSPFNLLFFHIVSWSNGNLAV